MTNGATIPQPRDENGHFTSLEKLFDRERLEHARDHELERLMVRENAQRIEREVEKAALRIAEEVRVALLAVGETARVHSEAHAREHISHERIHSVEKEQVDKAESLRDRDALTLSKNLEEYKKVSNEWRGALQDQSSGSVTRAQFDTEHERLISVEKKLAYYSGGAAVLGAAIAYIIRLSTGG